MQFDPNEMSWVHDSTTNGGLGIVDLWSLMGVTGEGVNVVVIDTGIIEHDDFKKNGTSIIRESHYINGLSSIIDSDGHGTNSASIIGATGNKNLFGVAPNVELYIIKTSENQYVKKERFLSGLKLVKNEWPIDIISISYCFDSTDIDFENYFNSINENCIVLSALNHPEGDKISINNSQYPAFYNKVIPVVAIQKSLKDIMAPCELFDSQNKPNWGFPGEDILALNENGNYQNAQQTSIATPLGSGIIALFISYMKKNSIVIEKSNITKLKDLLSNTATVKDVVIDEDGKTKTAKILYINPFEAFGKFNNYF